MKIALIQSSLVWENAAANRREFQKKIDNIDKQFDLIILPEMFSTGFTMNPKAVAETMQGDTVAWLKMVAHSRNCAITGSIVITENKKYYNRMLFVFPCGELLFYDKRHLFTLAGEDKIYAKGSQKVIVNYLDWKICLQVCYDLRFPVFSRNTGSYDLLLYIASWPEVRVNAWDALLKARAIENLSYVVGVNRVGTDDNGFRYTGHSQVVDYLGNYLVEPAENESVVVVNLDKNKLNATRTKLGFLDDRDNFEIEL